MCTFKVEGSRYDIIDRGWGLGFDIINSVNCKGYRSIIHLKFQTSNSFIRDFGYWVTGDGERVSDVSHDLRGAQVSFTTNSAS